MSAGLPKIEVHLAGVYGSSVTIDGFEIPGLRDIAIRQDLGGAPLLTLSIISDNVTITGEADIALRIQDVSQERLNRIVEEVVSRLNREAQSRR